MAIEYYPQYSLLVTTSNESTNLIASTTSSGSLRVNVVAGGAGNGSVLDGSDTAIKATVVSYANANVIAVRLSDTNGNYIAPGAASNVTVSNLATVPLTVSGTTIAITSLPPLGAATVSVNSFTFVLSITNLASVPLTISGTTIAITSLPPLGAATVSISPISLLCTVTAASIFRITSLPAIGFGGLVSVSNGTIVQVGANTNYWSLTSTYTSAQTNVVLKSEPSSTTAFYITDIIFSNSSTEGNLSLIESRPNAAIRVKLETLYFRPFGGAVINLRTPIVLDTNAALCMTSRSVTGHSVSVVGYTA